MSMDGNAILRVAFIETQPCSVARAVVPSVRLSMRPFNKYEVVDVRAVTPRISRSNEYRLLFGTSTLPAKWLRSLELAFPRMTLRSSKVQ